MRRFGDRDMYTLSQVAKRLGVHVNTVRLWCLTGKIEFARTPGGHYRIPDEAMQALMFRPARPANDNAVATATEAA